LVVEETVAASTQNQALNALVFLYREVLHENLDGPIESVRAKRPKRLPTVLAKQEALTVINHLSGTYQLIARILYGSGLRLMECLRLRVKACPELFVPGPKDQGLAEGTWTLLSIISSARDAPRSACANWS